MAITLTMNATAQNNFFALNKNDDTLRHVNTNTGKVRAITQLTMGASSIQGANGMAKSPVTGEVYGVLKVSASRVLAQIDTATGVCTQIGVLGDQFASITVDHNDTLWGVTGDGAGNPETLYRIDKNNALITLASALGNGDDGEALGFNPDDSTLYHASGIGAGRVFETIRYGTYTTTNIPLSGDPYGEGRSLWYRGNDEFIITDGNFWFSLTTTGLADSLVNVGFAAKGVIEAGPIDATCPVPLIVEGPSQTINEGQSATITVQDTCSGCLYVWSTSDTAYTISVSPADTTTYCVTVTCANDSTSQTCHTIHVIPQSTNPSEIQDIAKENMLQLHPNPSNGYLFLSLRASDPGLGLVNIKDIQGRTVHKQIIRQASRTDQHQIQLANLPDGIYVLQLHLGDVEYLSKFVLQH